MNYQYASKEAREARKKKMLFLRETLGWTCQQIADEYEITRERVRQIIGNTGWCAVPDRLFLPKKKKAIEKHEKIYREQIRVLDNHDTTTRKIADVTGLSYNYVSQRRRCGRHVTESALSNAGMIVEDEIAQELRKRGFPCHTMNYRAEFDIQLEDGRTVEVKSRLRKQKSPTCDSFYFFVLRRTGKTFVPDFYVLKIFDDTFIIPSEDLNGKSAIGFRWPTEKRTTWQKYHNRYDLLGVA